MGEITLLLLIFFVFSATITVLAPWNQHTFIFKESAPDMEYWHIFEKLTYGIIIFIGSLSSVYSGDASYKGVYICLCIEKSKLIC